MSNYKSLYVHYSQNEYTKEVAEKFIRDNITIKMHFILMNLTQQMHTILGWIAINLHTHGLPYECKDIDTIRKSLTIHDCRYELKKIYTMYYNIYIFNLLPDGYIRNPRDHMNNFKNRIKVIQANMLNNTILDGNEYSAFDQHEIIIPSL